MRWPKSVYDTGNEPDYRFSFANERTALAWNRTALALLAGGVALNTLDVSMDHTLKQVVAVGLVMLAALSAAASWLRWAKAERAVRRGEPLPASPLLALVSAMTVLVAIVVAVATL